MTAPIPAPAPCPAIQPPEPPRRRRSQAERRSGTRARLISAARAAFAEQGFEAASLVAIAAAAGVSSGAVYHQFPDKAALFAAAFRAVCAEVRARIEAAAAGATDARSALLAGTRGFLAAAADPAIARLYLVDGPAVLGWATWREIDMEEGGASPREGLTAAGAQDAEAATLLLSGAMNEAALWLRQEPTASDRALALLERLTDAALKN